jgi:Ca2+-binding EF-hand superfamily protein
MQERARMAELRQHANAWAHRHHKCNANMRIPQKIDDMLEDWFSVVDADGGGISAMELHAALVQAGLHSEQRAVMQLIDVLDADNSGAHAQTPLCKPCLRALPMLRYTRIQVP